VQDDDPKGTLEEIQADLAAMGFGFGDEEEKKAHHLRCDAIHYGKVCGVCGKEFGSAVWRDRIATGHDWSPWRRQKYWIVPVCGECKTRDEWGFGDPWIDKPRPCVGCGRSVYNRWNWKGQYAVRSNACEPAARAKRARDLSAKRREGMTCEQCGKDFTPPRDDAKFCSSSCRQQAYRERSRPKRRKASEQRDVRQ